jgi:nitric oxide reductase subunit C
MLSKSAARKFFLVGTALCSVSFVFLTIDSIRRIPAQTHQANLTESAIRGKHLFDRKNCMGCHTILGEGAYYAPELTKVYERRGPEFIRALLKDPESMYPGQRKMVNYHLSDAEIADLTAFFKWIGEMDLNGFPAKPDLAAPVAHVHGEGGPAGAVAPARAAAAQPKMFGQVCIACHSLSGAGGKVGPALDGVGDKFPRSFFVEWLKDPAAVKPTSKMPKLPLSDADIDSLATYLATLKAN